MPLKITTETDLVRLLSKHSFAVGNQFHETQRVIPKNTPIEHMMMFYKDFLMCWHEKFDGMIITGAPVETMDFEDVEYWDEITQIFSWARTHVTSTLLYLLGSTGRIVLSLRHANIRCLRRCSVSSASTHWIRNCQYFVDSTMYSICRRADTPVAS